MLFHNSASVILIKLLKENNVNLNAKSILILIATLTVTHSLYGTTTKSEKTLPEPKSQMVLGVIDGESDAKVSTVNIRFNAKPSYQKVPEFQNHGSFLQLNLANVIVPEPGKFIDGNSKFIKKIAVFQMTPNDASVRLFLSESATAILPAINAAILDNRIIVSLDHSKLETFLARHNAAAQSDKAESQAKKIVAETVVDTSIPAPANALKSDTPIIGKATPNFRKQLINIALFCGSLILFFLGVVLFKPYFKKHRFKADKELIEMKTIGTLALASKQKLSLVQIGDEKILLGVTPENISFITTVSSHSKVSVSDALNHPATSSFKGLLQQESSSQTPANSNHQPTNNKAMDSAKVLEQAPRVPNKSRPLTERPLTKKPEVSSLENKDAYSTPLKAPTTKGSRINVGVGEDGVQNLDTVKANIQSSKTKITRGDGNAQAIEDVTRLIRNKLKTLKSI